MTFNDIKKFTEGPGASPGAKDDSELKENRILGRRNKHKYPLLLLKLCSALGIQTRILRLILPGPWNQPREFSSLTSIMHLLSLVSLAGLATTVYSHGLITSPASRAPGSAQAAVCGQLVVNGINSDNTSYVEALTGPASRDSAYNAAECNLYLCKGMQFGDNSENVHEWVVGQKVDIEVWLRIPHLGYANVSIVDTKTDTYVEGGESLIYWDQYADEKLRPNYPADQTAFTVTVPDLGGACKVAGECVSFAPSRSGATTDTRG